MNERPLVSVITPTFNRARFLVEAIESVLAQSYDNFEMIIVDDGSTDDTKARIEPYLSDSRIQYTYQSNQGQSAARNVGIRASQGELIGFLDSDNRWLPEKLEKQIAFFRDHPETDIVYGDGISIDEDGNEIARNNMRRYSGHITELLLRDNFVSINTALVRRRCFDQSGLFMEQEKRAVDYELWLRLSTQFRFDYIPEFFSQYRIMEDQISSDKEGRFSANERIIRGFFEQYPNAVSEDAKKEGWCRFYTRKGRYLASQGRRSDAIREYGKALQYRPLSVIPWRAIAKLALNR